MYQEIKEQITEICHKMWMKNWAAANDGNISVKVGENRFLTTQTGVSKGDIAPEMIGLIDGSGTVIEAADGFRPSSEVKMHLRCYRERDDIGAVVHAHPPYATGYACAHQPLDDFCLIGQVIFVGAVPLTPYATPSTDEVPDTIAPFLQEHDVLLLANHGALAVGADLSTAYYRMEMLEHQAQISLIARQLGGAADLPRKEIDRLIGMRGQYGATGRHAGYEKFSE